MNSLRLPVFLSVFVILSAMCSVKASAQDQHWQSFRSRMDESRVKISYSFVLEYGSSRYSSHGELLFQDNSFKLEDQAFSVYDDKNTQWMVNTIAKEVTVSHSGVPQLGFLHSPSSLLEMFGQNPDGAEVSMAYSKDGLPVRLNASIGSEISVTVLFPSIEFLPKSQENDFTFDTGKIDSSYIVTDMR